MEPPFLAKSKIDRYGSRLVLDFMEPSLPSSYKICGFSLPTTNTGRLANIEHDAKDQKLRLFY